MTLRLEVGIDCRDPEALAVFLQRMPEPKQGKNRVHLDLYVPDAQAHVDRLVRLGATRLGAPQGEGDDWYQVLADPEGNELCVCTEGGGVRLPG